MFIVFYFYFSIPSSLQIFFNIQLDERNQTRPPRRKIGRRCLPSSPTHVTQAARDAGSVKRRAQTTAREAQTSKAREHAERGTQMCNRHRHTTHNAQRSTRNSQARQLLGRRVGGRGSFREKIQIKNPKKNIALSYFPVISVPRPMPFPFLHLRVVRRHERVHQLEHVQHELSILEPPDLIGKTTAGGRGEGREFCAGRKEVEKKQSVVSSRYGLIHLGSG